MIRQCAWCRQVFTEAGWVSACPRANVKVTHGICEPCLNNLMVEVEMDKELRDRLNAIESQKLKLQRRTYTDRVHNAFPWAVLAGLLVLVAGVMIIAGVAR